MATLLDQFKNAVDMMHTVPQSAPTYTNPVAYQPQPMVQPSLPPTFVAAPPQYLPAIQASSAPAVAQTVSDGKPFFAKKGFMVVAAIVIVGLIVALVFVFKNKGGNKKKRSKGLEDDEEDDAAVLDPRLRGPQQQQQPGFQAPPGGRPITSIPTLQPIANNIPMATPDMRYTEASLRGAMLPPNTRGADANMQPTGMGAHMLPQMPQQPASSQPGQILPLPGPTMQGGIPLAQPMMPPQQPPMQPPMSTISQVAATMPQQQQQPSGDPNFTKL